MTLNEIKAKLKLHLVADLKLDVILKGEELKDDEILFGEDSRFDLDSLDYLTMVTTVEEHFGVGMTLESFKFNKVIWTDVIETINSISAYIYEYKASS